MAAKHLHLLASNALVAVSVLAGLATLTVLEVVTAPLAAMRAAYPDEPCPWAVCAVSSCYPLACAGVTWMSFAAARLRRGADR